MMTHVDRDQIHAFIRARVAEDNEQDMEWLRKDVWTPYGYPLPREFKVPPFGPIDPLFAIPRGEVESPTSAVRIAGLWASHSDFPEEWVVRWEWAWA